MNPFGLYLMGGAVSVAAVTVALNADGRLPESGQVSKDLKVPRQGDAPKTSESPDQPISVPQRSVTSKNKDISMATLLRPQATVTVSGQVRAPGPVSFRARIMLEEAIQQAGGATEFGAVKRVKLLRKGEQKGYDATDERFRGLLLEAGDLIEVPEKMVYGR